MSTKSKSWSKIRSDSMLTVEVLIDYLKKQDPKACILGFETNANAYTEQLRDIPNHLVCTVHEAREKEREWIRQVYRDYDPKKEGFNTLEELVESKVNEVFRYARDTDIIIQIGT